MIRRREAQVGAAQAPPALREPSEGGGGAFVEQVTVDKQEDVSARSLGYHVPGPDLLEHGLRLRHARRPPRRADYSVPLVTSTTNHRRARRATADDPLTRRTVLRLMVAAAAAGPARASAAAAPLERSIPSSGEKIPAVGLGTWRTFDVGASAAERTPLEEVLRKFAELGGRVIDSSPMYGAAESVVGDLAAGLALADRLFLATKVWTSGRDAGVRQMEQSLRRLRARRLDLMQIHNLLDWRTHLATLRDWKAAGRVRYIGVTHYTASAYDELERVLQGEALDFVQVNYSLGERDAERRILPLARDRGVAVLVNRPFSEGGLFHRVRGQALPPWAAELDCESWAQFFLKWILAHPAVTCVIPATSRPQHLVDNMRAGTGRLPDAAARERMAALVAR
jgi:diketogulonate reductase-like aldo/keto reductase